MPSAFQSLHHALRRLRRAPAFSVAAMLTLMLGIGATTAVFSVVNGVLLRPLPYPRPHRLVDLSHTITISGASSVDQSDATYLYYRRANRVFSDVAAYRVTGVNLGRVSGALGGGDARAERLTAGRVSASTFGVLGAAPLHGRTFRDDDDRPGAPPVAIIGQRVWERKYGADLTVIGRALEVDGVPREVVGIMPAGFDLPGSRTDVWLPIGIDPAHTASAAFDYRGVARLRDGVSLDAAARDLQRLLPDVPQAFPGRLTRQAIDQIRMRAIVRPLRDVVVGDVGRVLWVVLGAVGCVLLIACANVMNLFLVRAEGRQHELAVRRALGAGRWALVREHLVEGALLSVMGGALALGLAAVGVRVLRSVGDAVDVPRLWEVRVDGSVLALTAGVTVLAVLLVGALPALRAASTAASQLLNETGRSLTAARGRHRARQALVIAQLALALMLLAGAGLMGRSFAHLRAVPSGLDAAHAFTVRVALPDAAYAAPGRAHRFIARAIDEIAATPGVEAVGAITKLPLLAESRRDTALFVDDGSMQPGRMPNLHQVAFASPGYFRAMGIPVIEGRLFNAPEPARAPKELVVSRALARRYWPNEPAVGKSVRLAPLGAPYTVVGVAGDVRGTALEQPPDEIIYLPLVVALGGPGGAGVTDMLWTPRDIAFVARSGSDPTRIAARVARAVGALDPSVPVYGARTMTEVVGQAAVRTMLTLTLLGIASAIALALGAVGIYGVMSYVMSLRTREIAVRLALGARPAQVRRMMSLQAGALAAAGIIVGLAGALALTRLLSALLFGVSPADPVAMAGAAAVLGGVAAVASWLPARRAALLDPAQALRAE